MVKEDTNTKKESAPEADEEIKKEEKVEAKEEEKVEAKEEEKVEAKEEKEDVKKKVQDDKRFTDIIDKIGSFSVVELADLVKVLEQEFGVSAVAPAAAAASGDGAGGEEKSEFNVVLKAGGNQKIPVIKTIKEITGMGLKEAKELVDSAPKAIKEGVNKEDAEDMKKKLEEVGATIELQ